MGVAVRTYNPHKNDYFSYSTCISSFLYSRCKKECQMAIFYFKRRACKLCYYGDVYYGDVIHSFYWKSDVEHDGCV